LKPLLGTAHVSKCRVAHRQPVESAIHQLASAIAGRRTLSDVFLDGGRLKVRLARRVVSIPVLAALGVAENGQKCLLTLRAAVSEAAATWGDVVADLQQRGLAAPLLLVVDGNAGLHQALARWPGVRVQRCTTHKLENLKTHCPEHALPGDEGGLRSHRVCGRWLGGARRL
jgi:transposase-like protein